MAGSALSIKLRCASWQQLATIYRRDLSRGAMFLRAQTQPPIGTMVRIDLELPSATVIELSGAITQHVTDPQRGTGVELKLEPLPTKSVWLIESALAAENKMRAATPAGGVPVRGATGPVPAISEGQDVAAAEVELLRALEAEAESLRKLNPFLVLGVGYETTDADVRASFGELTKRYHPDRFARYQSERLRQIAAEIFILIRDAYRKLADTDGRAQALAAIGKGAPPRATPSPVKKVPSGAVPPLAKVAVPPVAPKLDPRPPPPDPRATHHAPTNPSRGPGMERGGLDPSRGPGMDRGGLGPPRGDAALAGTQLARNDDLAIAVEKRPGPAPKRITPPGGVPRTPAPATAPLAGGSENTDAGAIEAMIDAGKLDEAVAAYRAMARKHPQDRGFRAGIELCEGLRALAARDRLEAAQRFEAALELDPSNERAARELADMRRQATNERKGLLSRLMGKKEPT